MSKLTFCLFGRVQVYLSNPSNELRLTRSLQTLLSYLLLNRERMQSRELVAGLLWPDRSQEKARGCLSSALWRLRKILEQEGIPPDTYLIANEQEVGFNPKSDYWLDISTFEKDVGSAIRKHVDVLEQGELEGFRKALDLYQGDLLNGVYEDWVLREREQLRLLYLNGKSHLMQFYKHLGDLDQAIAVGHQILALDPLREEIYRELMQLYLSCGQHVQAARQYETCRATLKAELGIAPMEETRQIFSAITSANVPPAAPEMIDAGVELQQALKVLYQSEQAASIAHLRLRHAIEVVERCLKGPDQQKRFQ